MRRLAPLLLLPLLLGAAAARDPLAEAEARLWEGKYDDVESWVKRTEGAHRPEAEGLLGESLRRRGRYADARKPLESALVKHGKSARRVG